MAHPLFSGTFLMVGGGMAINVVNYLYHLLMGRVLMPEGYGALASIFSIIYIVSIVPQATSVAVVKFVSSAKTLEEQNNIYFSLKKKIQKGALIGAIGIGILSPAIANYLHIQDVLAVATIAPIFYFSVLAIFDQSALQGILQFFGVVFSNAVSSIGKLIIGLSLIYFGLYVRGATFGIVLAVAISYITTQYFIRRRFVIRKNKEVINFSELVKYSLPVFLQALAFTSLFTVDLILVKHLFPEREAGLYAALSTLGKIIYFASSPIASVMFPLVSKKRSFGEPYHKIFIASLLITVLTSGAIVMLYWLFPHTVITTLYGDKYAGGEASLIWMGIFIAVYTICQLLVNFFLSINKTKLSLLPVGAAILQIVLISSFHSSLTQVIQMSVLVVTGLLVLLTGYLIYSELQFHNEK